MLSGRQWIHVPGSNAYNAVIPSSLSNVNHSQKWPVLPLQFWPQLPFSLPISCSRPLLLPSMFHNYQVFFLKSLLISNYRAQISTLSSTGHGSIQRAYVDIYSFVLVVSASNRTLHLCFQLLLFFCMSVHNWYFINLYKLELSVKFFRTFL